MNHHFKSEISKGSTEVCGRALEGVHRKPSWHSRARKGRKAEEPVRYVEVRYEQASKSLQLGDASE